MVFCFEKYVGGHDKILDIDFYIPGVDRKTVDSGSGSSNIVFAFIFQPIECMAHIGGLIFMAGGSRQGFIIVIKVKLKILEGFAFTLKIMKC